MALKDLAVTFYSTDFTYKLGCFSLSTRKTKSSEFLPLSLRYSKYDLYKAITIFVLLAYTAMCITIFFRQRTVVSLTTDENTASTTTSLATRLAPAILDERLILKGGPDILHIREDVAAEMFGHFSAFTKFC